MVEFLPQYAAKAVADCEEITEAVDRGMKLNPENVRAYLSQDDNKALYQEAKFFAASVRAAVHVVLPKNGEIYRANYPLPTPTADEIESLNGLPAPTTCFEFECDTLVPQTKMVALIIDRKQLDEGQTGIVVAVSREDEGRFPPTRNAVFFPMPLEFTPQADDKTKTGVMCRTFRVSKARGPFPDAMAEQRAVELVSRGLHAAIQCCHSLRAGATLEEQRETSASRRWKMEKRGVAGFTYHVLKLPAHVAGQSGGGGSHESPRFHVRRAHIRKLPTGVLTFVRQCFVGDRERGIVSKHYDVSATDNGGSQHGTD